MRHIKSTCMPLVLLACLYVSPPLLAGPLDRMDTGPRVNPATNNMLRVPGVVGMDYQSALATLEQAGLNPRVHMLHKPNGKYAGQEGIVVKQLPTAGGVAMIGSSVSISVYAPDNGQGPGNGGPDQGPPYDQGNGGGDMGGSAAAPGQQPPASGDQGQGSAGNGGIVPPSVPVGGGWQGPTGNAGPDQQSGAPAEQPGQPEKQQTPVVKVPVKRPGHDAGKGQGSAGGATPSEPERKQAPAGNAKLHPITVKHPTPPEKQQAPVVKVPVKRPGHYAGKGHGSASSAEGSGPPTGPERERRPVAHKTPKKGKTRVHHATPVKHAAAPGKGRKPSAVKVPVKRPGHDAGKGSGSAAGAPLSEPERKQTPVKRSGNKKSSASSASGSGKTFKPIDWGRKASGDSNTPSVPKKPEGHSALLGSQRGGL